ncbi:MAG: multicopper oxidase domain-containing protein, partial [Gammaproteobacteria bacterium]|nr:multicopper oxidase domain-containing protein [Gammaproteobacteria bacterium]
DMWVIATDGGYLDTPVKINGERNQTLNIMPGERYEVIIDFKDFGGQSLTLTNSAAMPFPFGAPVVGTPMESVMQFRVGLPKVNDVSFKPSSSARLRSVTQAIVRLANPITGTLAVTPAKTRQLTLNEVMGNPVDAVDPVTGTVQAYAGGPLEVLLNNTKWTGTSSRTNNDFTTITLGGASIAVSELPKEGTTEVWEIVNQTADAHPIHLHLVQFQLINRQAFDTVAWDAAYQAAFPTGAFQPGYGPPNDYRAANNPSSAGKDGGNPDVTPYLVGAVLPPSSQERGWKDTLIMYPGDVTRIAVRYAPTDAPVTAPAAQLAYPFDPSGGMQYSYVFHCHILDHEDNEMMRPKLVQLNPLAPLPTARRLVKGLNY